MIDVPYKQNFPDINQCKFQLMYTQGATKYTKPVLGQSIRPLTFIAHIGSITTEPAKLAAAATGL